MIRTLLTATLFVATVFTASKTQAYQLKQDSSGNTVRWTEAVRFVVDRELGAKLGDTQALPAIEAAIDSFRDTVPGLGVTLQVGKAAAVGFDRSGSGNENAIVVLEDWPFDAGFIAATVLTLDSRTHRILDADIALNAQHRKFKVVKNAASDKGFDDIQNTLTHELGHAFGLAHNPELQHAVMYPSALPGETKKRDLTDDDREGLSALYAGLTSAPLQSEDEPAVGCSASGSSRPGFSVLPVVLLWLAQLWARRPRPATRTSTVLGGRAPGVRTGAVAHAATTALATTVLAAAAFATGEAVASEVREPARLSSADLVFTAEVQAVRTRPVTPGTRLLFSDVELAVRGCLKGSCPDKVTVVVPGGRAGDLEQVVMGRPLPEAGDVLGVSIEIPKATAASSAAASVSGLSGLKRSPTGGSALYRLTQPEDFQAFAAGVAKSGLKLELKDLKPTASQGR